jgi:NADPH:quinone reductase-like Zn-dependent oxidoreductase
MANPTQQRAQQRVLLLQKVGEAGGFVVIEPPVPESGTGAVLVKVLAANVQLVDVTRIERGGLEKKIVLLPNG